MSFYARIADVIVHSNQVDIPKSDLTSNSVRTVLQIVFGLAGAIAFLIIVLAGLRFVIAAGDPQKTAQARNTIIYALIGLAVCILSFSIVTFVVKSL
jgi:hypothetical protein